jgi:chromosome partitioning protein
MTTRVLIGSRKGGVGKSTLARGLAVAAAGLGRQVLLADFDTEQLTCVAWQAKRVERDLEPSVEVASYKNLKRLTKVEERHDWVIADTPGGDEKRLVELARWCDAALLPTGFSDDDLLPTLALARRLKDKGLNARKLAVVFTRGGRSELQEEQARETLRSAGLNALAPVLPFRDGFLPVLAGGRVCAEAPNPYLRAAAEAVDDALLAFVERARRV